MSFNTVMLTLAILAICLPWVHRYKLKPFIAKKKLLQTLAKNPRLADLLKIEKFLHEVYQGVNAKHISEKERKKLNIKDDAFIYGEVTFIAFYNILSKVDPKPHEIFYDLGTGSGKPVLAAASFYNISKAYGIELLEGLFNKANVIKEKAHDIAKLKSINLSTIEFIKDNFLSLDISNGDIIFINATCLSYPTWEKLMEKLLKLKAGSRVIVTTKKIQNSEFKLLSQSFEIMSWGLNSVNIYEKISNKAQ